MPDRLKLNLRIVVSMAKLESPAAVRRQLQREKCGEFTNSPYDQTNL